VEESEEEKQERGSPLRASDRIQIDDEFRKSKRNLVWFCSFAILLAAVQSSPTGDINPPLLGSSVSMKISLLRFFVWLGCLYTFIGFYRHARDVDMVNSEFVSGFELYDVRQNLSKFGWTLAEVDDRLRQAIKIAPSWYTSPYDIAEAGAKVDEAARRLGQAAVQVVSNRFVQPREPFMAAFVEAQDDFKATLETEWGGIANSVEYNYDQIGKLKEMIESVSISLTKFGRIRGNFNRLSGSIRFDHRFLYLWYDKYLTYALVVCASLGTLWGIVIP
jgi:hypothetical protein